MDILEKITKYDEKLNVTNEDLDTYEKVLKSNALDVLEWHINSDDYNEEQLQKISDNLEYIINDYIERRKDDEYNPLCDFMNVAISDIVYKEEE